MNRIELDLNNPEFLGVFLELRGKELEQVARAIHRLQRYTWDEVYKLSGLNWETFVRSRSMVNQQPAFV
jgi:hypothetical protein